MRRRALLAAAAGTVGFAGCLSGADEPSGPGTDVEPTAAPSSTETTPSRTTPDAPPTSKATTTPLRRTAAGVTATFRVVDARSARGTPRPVTASFEGRRVVVTGAMDPAGCREPVLRSVAYDASARRVRLVVGTESPWGPTATVECGNAIYVYRATATVESGTPAAVEVVHSLHGREDRTVVLEAE